MSGEVQPRKRKDKKKKREESFKTEDSNDKSSLNDKEDSDEKTQDEDPHDHHHGPKAGILSKFVFFLLFGGLIFAVSTVFFQLKGSDIADTPIKESRYANILENFVDEHPPDDHDEAHHVADHDDHEEGEESEQHPPDDHGDEHDESEHEHSETHNEEEDSGRDKRDAEEQSQQDDGEPSAAEDEVSEQKTEEITLEPSMPDALEVERNEIDDADEDVDENDEESDDEQASEVEDAPESVAEEPAQEENEVQSEKEEESATEHADEVTEAEDDLSLDEQHPREEIPTLVDEDVIAGYYYEPIDQINEDSHNPFGYDDDDDIDSDEMRLIDEELNIEDDNGLLEGMFGEIDEKLAEASELSERLDSVDNDPEGEEIRETTDESRHVNEERTQYIPEESVHYKYYTHDQNSEENYDADDFDIDEDFD